MACYAHGTYRIRCDHLFGNEVGHNPKTQPMAEIGRPYHRLDLEETISNRVVIGNVKGQVFGPDHFLLQGLIRLRCLVHCSP